MNNLIKALLLISLCTEVLCTNQGKGGKGKPVNDFTLKSLDGREYTLSKLKGNVVVVDFWATWCPPCRREIPHLISLYEKYKEKGLIVLGVSAEDQRILETFRNENNITYPILLGNNEVFQKFGVRSIPHTIFYDKKGEQRKVQIGFSDELLSEFDELVQTLLNE
jgi:thiol-disulfide isomerase/thioredoxin